MTTPAFIQVDNLERTFPGPMGQDPVTVFRNLNFTIEQGEFVCLIGHSGCGKSTILNILAGLDEASAGYVFMENKEVTGPGLERGVVFQGHALMPWLTVRENVAFAVKSRFKDKSRDEINAHVEKFVDMVGLSHAIDKKPHQLSGGMRQRVGIARAFAIEPKMLLMDEPFGALDALTRGVIQDELLEICRATGQTVFMITHDVDEAILLADKILLMTNGPLAEVAECAENPLTKPRSRQEMHHDAHYYPFRNHLMDFLVNGPSTAYADKLEGDAPPPVEAPADGPRHVVNG
ncbi:ABC transporter ATP-binding protein [Guyparkeria hydrothermalis]|uniref:ABC transporter ATP-binding protein n=1 Tax=Guyparkeria hydrothermalis TaxID=923 RepID=UPI00202299D9|nr:ABC transporter ATP-binding protein [Guyparkeria hydrothermalis]MCL7743599.1 ABC transporter ATP-binding protein [Guyparkeria hydrothermalis]